MAAKLQSLSIPPLEAPKYGQVTEAEPVGCKGKWYVQLWVTLLKTELFALSYRLTSIITIITTAVDPEMEASCWRGQRTNPFWLQLEGNRNLSYLKLWVLEVGGSFCYDSLAYTLTNTVFYKHLKLKSLGLKNLLPSSNQLMLSNGLSPFWKEMIGGKKKLSSRATGGGQSKSASTEDSYMETYKLVWPSLSAFVKTYLLLVELTTDMGWLMSSFTTMMLF